VLFIFILVIIIGLVPQAIALTSKRAIALYPIRVHPRASAVQKCDRPYLKKSDRPFPHPRPSACICGSKVRSTGASKRAIDLL